MFILWSIKYRANIYTLSPTLNLSVASPAAIPPEPLTVEFRILAIFDLVPLILLLVTDEASRESELLPEEMVEVGLGSWLILWCLKFQFIAQAHITLISVLGSKLLCLKNKKDGVTFNFNLRLWFWSTIISWRRRIDYTFIDFIHLIKSFIPSSFIILKKMNFKR